MPEARLQRTRETLPAGYQFGRHHHDYRARWRNEWSAYRAICDGCGHDAGEVNTAGLHVLEGTTLSKADREVKLAVAELSAKIDRMAVLLRP